jgi:hypothetical protein
VKNGVLASFSLRVLQKVSGEFSLACAVHNLKEEVGEGLGDACARGAAHRVMEALRAKARGEGARPRRYCPGCLGSPGLLIRAPVTCCLSRAHSCPGRPAFKERGRARALKSADGGVSSQRMGPDVLSRAGRHSRLGGTSTRELLKHRWPPPGAAAMRVRQPGFRMASRMKSPPQQRG